MKICINTLSLIIVLILSANSLICASEIQIPHTGQNNCYSPEGSVIPCAGTGQDGDKLAGKLWPKVRYTDNNNGTVSDNLTGLTWLKDANCFGVGSWQQALISTKALIGNNSMCSLNDGSITGDWRLPNVNELESLVDVSQMNPALTRPHPFTNVQFAPLPAGDKYYWSDTTYAGGTDSAWNVRFNDGFKYVLGKSLIGFVWPVRGPQ